MHLKAGICVAYDWELLRFSLPSLYSEVEKICLSLDSNGVSWSGNQFFIDKAAFYSFIAEMDKDKKISIMEESFFDSKRNPMENECYQRKRMAEFLGEADWIIQLDADEILLNGSDFTAVLNKYKGLHRAANIHGLWINLIKQTEKGFIYSVLKTPPLATNQPAYDYGRTNGHFNIYENIFIGHITWARPEEEVHNKLRNWGHSHEFNGESFFKIWNALDDNNWKYIKDFHHMATTPIPRLYYHQAANIEEFKQTFNAGTHGFSKMELMSNNIWLSRLKKALKIK